MWHQRCQILQFLYTSLSTVIIYTYKIKSDWLLARLPTNMPRLLINTQTLSTHKQTDGLTLLHVNVLHPCYAVKKLNPYNMPALYGDINLILLLHICQNKVLSFYALNALFFITIAWGTIAKSFFPWFTCWCCSTPNILYKPKKKHGLT